METLYSWKARRSGGRITIAHSCGRVSNIDEIAPNENGQIIAVQAAGQASNSPPGKAYMLATPPHLAADHVNAGVSDLFFNLEQATEAYGRTEGDDDTLMLAAAEEFRTMLRCAGIAPPSAAALVADFRKRV